MQQLMEKKNILLILNFKQFQNHLNGMSLLFNLTLGKNKIFLKLNSYLKA